MTHITQGDFRPISVILAAGTREKVQNFHGWRTGIRPTTSRSTTSAIKGCWCHIITGEDGMQTDTEQFTMRDRLGPLSFEGRVLSDARFGRLDRPRWTDMALYEVVNPPSTLRSAAEIEKELVQDLSRELPFREIPRSKRAALLDVIVSNVVPRLVKEQPTYRYVLAFVARSFVYHDANGRCVRDRHRITTVGLVRASNHRWRNLFPCNKCRPRDLEDMRDNDRVAEEKEKHHLYLCTDAQDVLDRLYMRNGEISELATKLLIEAADNDHEIARVIASNRRVR